MEITKIKINKLSFQDFKKTSSSQYLSDFSTDESIDELTNELTNKYIDKLDNQIYLSQENMLQYCF